jgi:hypothetical protein
MWLTRMVIPDHETMLGLSKTAAGSELLPAKKHKPKVKKVAASCDDDGEEWAGIGAE